MKEDWQQRTVTLIGQDAVTRLKNAHVLVAGVGGVGGYAVETLVRCGIGNLTIIDADNVSESNINRQLVALHSTIGMSKVNILADRCRDINPDISINAVQEFITVDNTSKMIGSDVDFVVDAIDTIAPKISIIKYCLKNKIPIISSMGAGGRIDPAKIGYFDISETREDGLARVVRQRLKKDGIRSGLKVVASLEVPIHSAVIELDEQNKRSSLGTTFTVPSMFGIYLGNYVIRKLTNI